MPWAAIAGIGSAALGAYGAKKQSDAYKDLADQQNPYDIARANFQVNNFDRRTPFGSVDYRIDDRGTPDPKDDVYSMQQAYSQPMNRLLNAMLEQAGSSPATFQSAMPEYLQNEFQSRFGTTPSMPSYTPSQSNNVTEGWQPPRNNRLDNPQPPGELVPGVTVTPGQTSNMQVLDQAWNQGLIDQRTYDVWRQHLDAGGTGGGGGNRLSWGSAPDVNPNAAPEWIQAQQSLYGALYPPEDDKAVTQQSQPYDQQALQALIAAQVAQGGV
jgi:hypothetical protein